MDAFYVLVLLVACLGGGASYAISARGGAPAWASFGVGLLAFAVLMAFVPLAVGRY